MRVGVPGSSTAETVHSLCILHLEANPCSPALMLPGHELSTCKVILYQAQCCQIEVMCDICEIRPSVPNRSYVSDFIVFFQEPLRIGSSHNRSAAPFPISGASTQSTGNPNIQGHGVIHNQGDGFRDPYTSSSVAYAAQAHGIPR